MRRATRQRILMSAIVVVLLAAVGWQWYSDRRESIAHRLFALVPENIDNVEIAFRGAPAQHFIRREGHWRSASTDAAADDGWLEQTTELATTPVSEWRQASEFEAGKIGLAPPVAVLTLEGRRVEYGEITAVDRQRYVRIGDRVGFVAAEAMPRPARTKALPEDRQDM
jgi:hypothetical protein